jgi:GAF domain-containing protein
VKQPTSSSTEAAFAAFSAILNAFGTRQALTYLLSRTNYRFIGIFRFESAMAAAAVHYDRENPATLRTQEVPDTATYCCLVRNSKGLFTTANAMLDPRIEKHPAREVVLAYCGVPIMDAEGTLLGTLCHYDLAPRDPAQIDIELMLQVASTLAQGDHVPPYPSHL